MTIRNLYPDIKPTLNLNFAKVKALDPRITFTRASGATYYDVDGLLRTAVNNQARFDHDPFTGESLGLLIEEQRTNLALRSEQFDDAYWTKSNSTITSNALIAPDGTLTADKLVENTAASAHLFFRGGIASTATTFTASIYVKAAERSLLRIEARNENTPTVGGSNIDFNLATGTVQLISNYGGGVGQGTITDVGNGWYRCTSAVTVNTAGTTLVMAVYLGTTVFSYTGDGTSGLFIWGAQLEAGAFPTSYIKTEGSQATRLEDAASMTGTNFSSWYRQDEGTFCTESKWFAKRPSSAINYTFLVNNLSGSSAVSTGGIGLWNWSGSDSFNGYIFNNSGSNVWNPSISEAQANSTLISMTKQALAYKLMDSAIVANGFVNATAQPSSMPTTLSVLNLAIGTAKTQHINRISYYPQRLTNTQLQALTR